MLIITKPIANANTASSRIRCYRFLKYLSEDFSFKEFRYIPEGDLFFVQKIATPQMINFAKVFKSRRVPVVYDIDDDFGVWPNMDEKTMLNIASAITTDTQERKEYLEKFTKTPIHIIPDALDYVSGDESSMQINDEITSINTFGSDGGVDISTSFMLAIPENFSGSYISQNANYKLNRFRKIDWKLDTFLNELRKSDVSILVHPSDIKGSMKSNNRLLVCMSIGMPCIVSNTPAYRQTMEQVGCEFLVANEPSDVPEILNRISSAKARREISEKFHKYAWENFSPQKSSSLLGNLFKELRNKNA